MVNFEEGNLTAGTTITDQFEGLNISTSSEFGVMVFDTNNPTGEDYDLAAENLGNALIISEDGDTSDPDDNAAGGTIDIEFDKLTTVMEIGLLDIEESGGSVSLFDGESDLIEVREIEPFGDGRSFELDIIDVSGVARLELDLAGSGALTSLNFLSEGIDTSSEATQLTNTGWEKNGQPLGIWTNNSDVVKDLVSGIEVAEAVTANTLAGNDLIEGLVSSGTGFLNDGTIIAGSGNDSFKGSVIGAGNENAGLSNVGDFGDIDSIINTGSGADQVIGTVKIQGNGDSNRGIISQSFGEINTEAGDDQITGTVEVTGNGDFNVGFENSAYTLTDTGAGRDRITSTVKVEGDGNNNSGLSNGESSINAGNGNDRIISTVVVEGNGSGNRGITSGAGGIDLGAGDDYLYGAVEVAGDGNNNFGINNTAANIIRMGTGDDSIIGVGVDAFTGFSGGFTEGPGLIDLGNGNDRITGFGANQIVDGGNGIDLAEFEFSLDESITFGSSDANSIDITANEVTMSFTNVEEFAFANGSFTFDELISSI